jgi:hypothetical protein
VWLTIRLPTTDRIPDRRSQLKNPPDSGTEYVKIENPRAMDVIISEDLQERGHTKLCWIYPKVNTQAQFEWNVCKCEDETISNLKELDDFRKKFCPTDGTSLTLNQYIQGLSENTWPPARLASDISPMTVRTGPVLCGEKSKPVALGK